MAESRADAAARRAAELIAREVELVAYRVALANSRLNRDTWPPVLCSRVVAAEVAMVNAVAAAHEKVPSS